jgi:DNA polymerase III epsilon subunit-like protein
MFLFFDTETTGLPRDWNAPVERLDNWPRIVQIAWLMYDLEGKRLSEKQFIIKPEGFVIPEESSRVHGITTEQALSEGVDLSGVLLDFSNDLAKVNFLVAHNLSFDEKIVGAEFLRKQIDNNLNESNKICTMTSTIDFCRIPSATPSSYKWPKLSELHFKLFGEDFKDAHDAMVDTSACAKCFFELKNKGVIVLPEIKEKAKILRQGSLF